MNDITQQTMSYIDIVYHTLERWYKQFAAFTPNLIAGLIVFFLFLKGSRWLSETTVKLLNKFLPKGQGRTTAVSLVGLFRFMFVLLGTFLSLEIMGLSSVLWKFIGSLGVAGVIAGVALRDLVASMFSGILVGVDKSFRAGDYIQLANYTGTVSDIGFLTTKLITDDGKVVFIPNQVIFNAPFFNISASPQRRVVLDLEIPVDVDVNKAQQSIISELENLNRKNKIDDPVQVLFTKVTDGKFYLNVSFSVASTTSFLNARNEAIVLIHNRLKNDGISLITPLSVSISNSEQS
ncbi:small conductance mechanosensitive channel [Cruoricaptor ignavus]|uniref:Small conductance mechanosensitive channel n=1 Tax=Cruoricaptor ignavus TaxID=1118202 RepID=A0A1M6G493_9FLAO|nr:mechanosensitive ion channel family protein [Cruoricaptor ignavus]SHJ04637.1 small conductance mechanosensitive channel [Cruoricaptor ignavus]